MKNRLSFLALAFFVAFGFGCAKKAVRTDVGVEVTEKQAAPQEQAPAVTEKEGQAAPQEAVVTPPPSQEQAKPQVQAEAQPQVQAQAQPQVQAQAQPQEEMKIEDVLFDFDRYTIRVDAVKALQNDAKVFNGNKDSKITIEGHCDERGTDEYNIALGEKRARAVKKYLVDLGVAANRMTVVSYGSEKPFCTEHTEQCWQENRKAHFVQK